MLVKENELIEMEETLKVCGSTKVFIKKGRYKENCRMMCNEIKQNCSFYSATESFFQQVTSFPNIYAHIIWNFLKQGGTKSLDWLQVLCPTLSSYL